MAKLYISEYDDINVRQGVLTPIVIEPALVEQTPVVIGAEVDSASFSNRTRIVRLHADAICSVVFGTGTLTATTNSKRLAADQTEYFRVNPGDKLSCIANT